MVILGQYLWLTKRLNKLSIWPNVKAPLKCLLFVLASVAFKFFDLQNSCKCNLQLGVFKSSWFTVGRTFTVGVPLDLSPGHIFKD
jgi:hypothetical protein